MSLIKPGSRFETVRVVCVSILGAGGSKIIMGLGIGSIITFRLRKVLRDHDLQEKAFINGMGLKNADRLLIVRLTGFKDGRSGGAIVTFGNEDKAPSFTVDLHDVATYITEQLFGDGDMGGKAVNIGIAV